MKTKLLKFCLFFFAIICASESALANAEPIPIGYFTKGLEYHNAVLSPSGKYIAVQRSADEGKQLVAIVETKTLSLKSHIPAGSKLSPFNVQWVNDEKVIVEFTEEFKRFEHEFANGELMTMDADGKKKRMIMQRKAFISNTSNASNNDLFGVARVVHRLPKEEKHVLVMFQDWTESTSNYGSKPKLYKTHTTSGRVRLVTQAPSYESYFTFNFEGVPQYSVGLDKEAIGEGNILIVHRFQDKEWVRVKDISIEAAQVTVIASTETPEEVYIRAEYLDTPDKIFRYNMASNEKKLVFFHPEVDPAHLDINPKTGELISVHFETDYPNLHIVQPEHVYSRWYPALFEAFGGDRVRITSATDDQQKLIVHVSGSDEPGQFHLFDTQTKKLRYLFQAASWIDTEKLIAAEPIEFEARDGHKIKGYLTEPKANGGQAPLVVIPHGGPHGVRDWWSYYPDVQFLVSRGFAVLQVNFRGSGGYGYGFEVVGHRKWGSLIQHDIIDGTKWAAERSSIDSNKICIWGGSFGGYSALMSPMIEPDLYKCAIGFVGVYDLNLMWTTADIQRNKFGRNFLQQAIGDDQEELKRNSPLHNIDKLKAPVLVVHGEEDWRVNEKHYHVMKAALDKKGHPAEYMFVEKEGHGFADEKNRTDYYKKVEVFLNKYIAP